jgi:GNAT superfamily N-acetyltransferase
MLSAHDVRIIPRPLTPLEAACLHKELKTTPNILGYTVRELAHFPNVLVAETAGGDFCGACISKDLLFGWTDIAVLYVLLDFRGAGIGARLFTDAFARAWERQRHIYALSRNPSVIRLMEQSGMDVTRAVWKAPLAVHLHQQCHMSSLYRVREAIRKSTMRNDNHRFHAGMKRYKTFVAVD